MTNLREYLKSTVITRRLHKFLLWGLLLAAVGMAPLASDGYQHLVTHELGHHFLMEVIHATRITKMPVLILDENLDVLHANTAAAKFLGVPQSQLRSGNAGWVIPEDCIEGHRRGIANLPPEAVGHRKSLIGAMNTNRGRQPVEIDVSYATDGSGTHIYIVNWKPINEQL